MSALGFDMTPEILPTFLQISFGLGLGSRAGAAVCGVAFRYLGPLSANPPRNVTCGQQSEIVSPHRELQAGRTNWARALNTRLRVPCFSAWKRRSIGCRGNAKDTDPHQATSTSDAIRWMSAAAWSDTISGDRPAQCCSRREEGIAATSLLTPLNECSAEKLGRPPWEGGQKSG